MFVDHLAMFKPGMKRETLEDCRYLPQAMTALRIAFLLRCQAIICAARIHAPFGWAVLDDLERLKTGGCLRVSTLVTRVERELALVEHVLTIYDEPTSDAKSIPIRLRSRLKAIDIEPRAHVQYAMWLACHGDDLESILRATVNRIRARLTRLKAHLNGLRSHHQPNEVVGNLGRANTGVQLYFAVREAVAWTRQTAGAAHASGSVAISAALEASVRRSTTRFQLRRPQLRPVDTATIDRLFQLLRLAYIQDNEALPHELRSVDDPKTGRRIRIKTHDHAAQVIGRRYSFSEQWDAWQRSMKRKQAELPATATAQQFHQARQIDLAAKRDALAIVKRRSGRKARGAFDCRDALRAGILAGFTASR